MSEKVSPWPMAVHLDVTGVTGMEYINLCSCFVMLYVWLKAQNLRGFYEQLPQRFYRVSHPPVDLSCILYGFLHFRIRAIQIPFEFNYRPGVVIKLSRPSTLCQILAATVSADGYRIVRSKLNTIRWTTSHYCSFTAFNIWQDATHQFSHHSHNILSIRTTVSFILLLDAISSLHLALH